MTAFLSDREIKNYILSWFKNTYLNKNNIFYETLQKKENFQFKELATHPVLLDALCRFFRIYYDNPFTSSYTFIYEEIFQILLRWNDIRFFLKMDQELSLLSELAYITFVDNKEYFTKDDLLPTIEKYLTQCECETIQFSYDLIIETILNQGILIRVDDNYSFTHSSLCEYLTAKFIYENDLIDGCLLKYLPDFRYKNIFLFLVEMLKKRTDEFLFVIASYYSGSKNPYVKGLLFECKQRATYVDKDVWKLIEKLL